MLIVCPSCATSYMIDPAAVSAAGRNVRCARCKTTWFVEVPKTAPDVSAFVDGVIAEAEAQSAETPAPPPPQPPAPAAAPAPEPPADDFGSEPEQTIDNAAATAPIEHDAAADVLNDVPPAEAPSLVPPMGAHVRSGETAAATLDAEEMESFAARRERLRARRETKRKSSRWTAIILVLVAFNVALVGARNEVVRYLPQTASLFASIGLPVNLRNLKFENVKISKESENGVSTLIVDGTIVSTGNAATEVPRLRFSVRNVSGQEIYTWTALPSRSVLEPGEKLEFHSRLASPPVAAADVLVRFFNAQDAAIGNEKNEKK
jgi:predicted Zn finger-like uncharacterized protein